MNPPPYLAPFASAYRCDPRTAAQHWFAQARYGLFIHYGLYSLAGRGEWWMFEERVPIQEYGELSHRFKAESFDPEFLADLAVSAQMKYVTLVVKHHDGFSLFETRTSDFHSMNSAARRDFVAEFASACASRGLGLFLYYSYGADWRHPYSLPRERYESARPAYADQSYYLYREKEDFRRFIDDAHIQLRELLTHYGPVAGVWFDLISACYFCPEHFPVAETYELIRGLQPHALISFKQGFTGDEDFMAQELSFVPISERLRRAGASERTVARSEWAWNTLNAKPLRHEIGLPLQKKRWGWIEGAGHRKADEVLSALADAEGHNCNLLLNVGPMPDGSVFPADMDAISRVADSIRDDGFPQPAALHERHESGGAVPATLDA